MHYNQKQIEEGNVLIAKHFGYIYAYICASEIKEEHYHIYQDLCKKLGFRYGDSQSIKYLNNKLFGIFSNYGWFNPIDKSFIAYSNKRLEYEYDWSKLMSVFLRIKDERNDWKLDEIFADKDPKMKLWETIVEHIKEKNNDN